MSAAPTQKKAPDTAATVVERIDPTPQGEIMNTVAPDISSMSPLSAMGELLSAFVVTADAGYVQWSRKSGSTDQSHAVCFDVDEGWRIAPVVAPDSMSEEVNARWLMEIWLVNHAFAYLRSLGAPISANPDPNETVSQLERRAARFGLRPGQIAIAEAGQ